MAHNPWGWEFQTELFNENDSDDCGGETSEDEQDNVSVMIEGSEYDLSGDEDMEVDHAAEDVHVRGRPSTTLRGKNGFVWQTEQPKIHSDRVSEPVRVINPGPKGKASDCNEVWEFWELLFDKQILEIIVEHTNTKIERVCLEKIAKGHELQSYHHHTDVKEINAFISILYHSGLWKSHNVDREELWNKQNGITFYRCVMPMSRFMVLSVCLRFDDKNNRQREDRLAPIRDIWEIFINNCHRYYEPHNYCTVDEQLLGFRGRCQFRTYIKSKPDKRGLKIITLNDARTSYLINAIPYLGKIKTEREDPMSEHFFRQVTAPIHGRNRSVTCDDWFTSIPLLERMMEPPYRLKITGSIRKNRREIPSEMKVADKEPPAAKFCFSNDILLLSHTPKKNKTVFIASTELHTTEIVEGEPKVMSHYNSTKGGTDCFDQLCNSYTTARSTRRWPLRFFFGILDQAMVNARILHKCHCINKGDSQKILSARQCLRKLTLHLATPYLRDRYDLPTLRADVREGIAGILGIDQIVNADVKPIVLARPTRCKLCRPKDDRKTKRQCSSCSRPICDLHRANICTDCVEVA